MADVEELTAQVLGLFTDTLQHVHARFSHDDQQNLAKYARGIAERTFQLRKPLPPADRLKVQAEIDGFSGAIALMVDRYLLLVHHEVEKALLASLKISTRWLVKIVVTALV